MSAVPEKPLTGSAALAAKAEAQQAKKQFHLTSFFGVPLSSDEDRAAWRKRVFEEERKRVERERREQHEKVQREEDERMARFEAHLAEQAALSAEQVRAALEAERRHSELRMEDSKTNDLGKRLALEDTDFALYVGSRYAARNGSFFTEQRITHVLNVTPDEPCHFEAPAQDGEPGSVQYLRAAIEDSGGELLLPLLRECGQWLRERRAEGARVLVHCKEGRSRSCAILCGFLVLEYGMRMRDAYQTMFDARPLIEINAGFLQQLHEWEREVHGDVPLWLPTSAVLTGTTTEETKVAAEVVGDENVAEQPTVGGRARRAATRNVSYQLHESPSPVKSKKKKGGKKAAPRRRRGVFDAPPPQKKAKPAAAEAEMETFIVADEEGGGGGGNDDEADVVEMAPTTPARPAEAVVVAAAVADDELDALLTDLVETGSKRIDGEEAVVDEAEEKEEEEEVVMEEGARPRRRAAAVQAEQALAEEPSSVLSDVDDEVDEADEEDDEGEDDDAFGSEDLSGGSDASLASASSVADSVSELVEKSPRKKKRRDNKKWKGGAQEERGAWRQAMDKEAVKAKAAAPSSAAAAPAPKKRKLEAPKNVPPITSFFAVKRS